MCVCVFLCSHWSLVDVPLIFFCPADHVPDWQPRVLLGMVEARSVNVKKTTTTISTNTHAVLFAVWKNILIIWRNGKSVGRPEAHCSCNLGNFSRLLTAQEKTENRFLPIVGISRDGIVTGKLPPSQIARFYTDVLHRPSVSRTEHPEHLLARSSARTGSARI